MRRTLSRFCLAALLTFLPLHAAAAAEPQDPALGKYPLEPAYYKTLVEQGWPVHDFMSRAFHMGRGFAPAMGPLGNPMSMGPDLGAFPEEMREQIVRQRAFQPEGAGIQRGAV